MNPVRVLIASFFITFLVILLTPAKNIFAAWTFDTVPPRVSVVVNCAPGTTPVNVTESGGADSAIDGTCASGSATIRVQCTDCNTPSGTCSEAGTSQCAYVGYTVSAEVGGMPDKIISSWSTTDGGAPTGTPSCTNCSFQSPYAVEQAISTTDGTQFAVTSITAIDGAGNVQTVVPEFRFILGTCGLDLEPIPNIQQGSTGSAIAKLLSGSVDSVTFESSDITIATVTSPPSFNSPNYTSNPVTGEAVGSATITARGFLNGSEICSDSGPVTIDDFEGWWQVRDADVMADNGNITSLIPVTCTSPCDPTFNLDGSGGSPGVSVHSGTSSFGTGTVASTGWDATTSYSGTTYNYAWFASRAPSGLIANPTITGLSINAGDLKNGGITTGSDDNEYRWHYKDGDLTLTSTANLGNNRIILLVNGNLTIGNNLTFNDGGFFAVIASGDINVGASVTHTGQPAPASSASPGLQGVYLADGQFRTGIASSQLYVKGSVVGWGGISLQRDLGTDNNDTPAEFFEFDPNLIFTLPSQLQRQGVIWKEIAP